MKTDRPPVGELLNLTGQRILITGASGNIGRQIARRLSEAGASVVLHFCNGKGAAESLADNIRAAGGEAETVWADLGQESDVLALFDGQKNLSLDGVVNNAAAQPVTPMASMSFDEWRHVMAANLDGAYLVSQLAAAAFAGRGGSIVNIASIEGVDPAAGHAHYSASKAALIMLTRSLALEYGRLGIRANAVSPGLIDRDGLADDWPDGVMRWKQKVPLSRMGEAGDVADAVLFLMSPAARWISGANLLVDGGMSSVSRW